MLQFASDLRRCALYFNSSFLLLTINFFYMQELLWFLNYEGHGHEWMVYLIVGCALLMWAECKFIRGMHIDLTCNDCLYGNMMLANCVLSVISSCIIFYYVFSMGNRSLWFITPSEVKGPLNGWIYTIGNGIVFYYVLVNMVVNFFGTMNDFTEYLDEGVDVRWGFALLAVGVLGYIICLNWQPEYATYVLWAVIASQVIQLGVIFYKGFGKIPIMHIVGICLVYLLGSLSTIVLCAPLVIILVILVVTLLVLTGLSKMPVGSGSTDNGPKHVTIFTNATGGHYYIDENGNTVWLNGNGNDSNPIFTDSKGHSFDENGYRH